MENILLIVTGGISAYKAVNICSKLKKANHNVKVILTNNAQKFITTLPFESISNNSVITDMFTTGDNINIEHIAVAKWATKVLVAPTTFNFIGKIVSGICDDVATTTITAINPSSVTFALAMNSNMYENAIFKENIEKLLKHGYKFIYPDSGDLACGDSGVGRLKDENEIIKELCGNNFLPLKGKNILITNGATREKIDPIRYITNSSSGTMGYNLAKEAYNLGAKVTIVDANLKPKTITNINTISVNSAQELYDETLKIQANFDIIIGVSAVSDYRVKHIEDHKIKKDSDTLTLELVKNPDTLLKLGKIKNNRQFLVGFAAESQDLIESAKNKLKKKNLDLIVANDTKYFASDKNSVVLIDKTGNTIKSGLLTKNNIAKLIVKEICSRI